jgi:hypothetical protein
VTKKSATKAADAAAVEPEAEVIVLRTCNEDMTSHGGFKWPDSGEVSAPDWDPRPVCGYGLHGLLEGEGDWGLMNWNLGAKALLVRVVASALVQIGGKVKFPRGVVVKVTQLAAAVCELLCNPKKIADEVARITALARKGNKADVTAASGDASKLAASGDASKLAASGYASQLAASGYESKLAASGDASKLAASGDASQLAASGYESKLAASGNASIALAAGYRSAAKAGARGVIALTWYDEAAKRPRLTVGYVGENGIEADVFYRVDAHGTLVRA